MRRVLLSGVGTVTAVLLGVAATPAAAEHTSVTFTVAAGALSISVPTSATLGSSTLLTTGTSVTAALGATTVTDSRGAVAGTWTVSVSGTDFSDGDGHTIERGNASIYSGVPSATSGAVVFVPTTVANPVSLAGTGGTLATATGVAGAASVTYSPTLTVTVPSSTVAGTYTGTVTQTVA